MKGWREGMYQGWREQEAREREREAISMRPDAVNDGKHD